METILESRGREKASSYSLYSSVKLEDMVQEDSFRINSNRSGKKPKPKKIPQRGLGVAQLEKIRLEEQQKTLPKTPHAFPPLKLPPAPNPTLELNKQVIQDHQNPSYAIPTFHSLLASSQCTNYPPTPFLPPKWSHSELDARKLCFPPLPNDATTFSKQPTMVKFPPTTSSGVTLPILEPPSNQINHKTNLYLQEEDKIIGGKRPWSFLRGNPSSSSSQGVLKSQDENGILRERENCCDGKWKLSPDYEPMTEDDNVLDGAFLTLGPSSSSSSSSSNSRSLPPLLAPSSMCDFHLHQSQMSVGMSNGGDMVVNQVLNMHENFAAYLKNNNQDDGHLHYSQPLKGRNIQFYSFLRAESGHQPLATCGQRKTEGSENNSCIDLNLKL